MRHNEILVMDNAATHIGGEASIVEDLLWNVENHAMIARLLGSVVHTNDCLCYGAKRYLWAYGLFGCWGTRNLSHGRERRGRFNVQ